MKKIGSLASILLIGVLVFSCTKINSKGGPVSGVPGQAAQNAGPTLILKVGSGGPLTLPMYMAAEEVFKPMVEQKSGGRISVELYPSSQLGDDVKLVEQLRTGTLECAIPVPSPMVGLVPELAIFDTPFLFSSAEVADRILDGPIGQELDKLLEDKGLINLGWGEMGFRHVTNARRDIRTPDDLKGLKLRTMENPIHIATWRALGVNATPMPVSEVFTAIQQGAIDGQENPVSGFYGWKIHEVNKHISLTGHVYSPNTILVSKRVWDTYDQPTKDIILEAGKATAKRSREIARVQEALLLDEMKGTGCTIIEFTDAQKRPFQQATSSVLDLVSERVGPELFNSLKKELGI
jgi:tripartite ATP-independent transporter DctP family solute receptor